MYEHLNQMSDLDFVIYVNKSSKCMTLLEKVDERLTAYNKRGMRILIKKVHEGNLPEGVTAVPECNIKGEQLRGVKAILHGLDKICRPKRREPNPDDLEEYYNSSIGTAEDAKADAAEEDVDDSGITKSEIDKKMADYARRAPKHRRGSNYEEDDSDDDEPVADTRLRPRPRPKQKSKSQRQNQHIPDSDDEDSDSNYDDEPSDNIQETNPDAGLDLDEEMKRIINEG